MIGLLMSWSAGLTADVVRSEVNGHKFASETEFKYLMITKSVDQTSSVLVSENNCCAAMFIHFEKKASLGIDDSFDMRFSFRSRLFHLT